MSTALAKGLLEWARKIGKWIITRLAKHLADRVAAYMLLKVEDFERRLAKARTPRRRRWLSGRIERWTAAARWLIRNSRDLATCAGSEFTALAQKHPKLPMVAAVERCAA